MPKIYEKLDSKKARDVRVLSNFVQIYCRQRHITETKEAFAIRDDKLLQALDHRQLRLCQDCTRLLNHGIAKRLLCPYDPKPMCKKCQTHCYAPGYRERVREVMRFSGLYLIGHGRFDLLIHYFF